MSRKSHNTGKKRRNKKSSGRGGSSQSDGPKRGWLSPKVAIAAIILVSVFSAGNVLFAMYKEGFDLGTMVVITFLALVTPGLAAALVYYIREKLAG